jgi:hypothetical protein
LNYLLHGYIPRINALITACCITAQREQQTAQRTFVDMIELRPLEERSTHRRPLEERMAHWRRLEEKSVHQYSGWKIFVFVPIVGKTGATSGPND